MSATANSPLHVLIEGRPEGSSLDVSAFCSLWHNVVGGTLTYEQQKQQLYTFSWECTEEGLARLRDYDKHGGLDQRIASQDDLRVLEVTHNEQCIYQYIPPVPSSSPVPGKDASIAEMKAVAQTIDLLVMTVTDTERAAFLPFLKPLQGQQAVLKGAISDTTYRFGQFGRYRVAHVESTMGSSGRHGATLTAANAIHELKPKALILLGIAFGVDRKKQRLGDVIVAEVVCNYEPQKVNEEVTISRGREVQCGPTLSERFRMRREDWDLPCGMHRKVQVHQGLMLSGEKLVNNKKFRDELVAKFPAAFGGEMEGAGAYAAATGKNTEVILVKAICDWADGDKNDRAQLFAAYAAVHLAAHVLSKPDVLRPLAATDVGVPGTEENPHPSEASASEATAEPAEEQARPVDTSSTIRPLMVFLCHAPEDQSATQQLYQQLKDHNIKPWLPDKDVLAGQDRKKEIARAIRKTDVVIACLSPESVTKAGHFHAEIAMALDLADEQPEGTIFIIPIKLKECVIPDRLSHLQPVNLFESRSFESLLRALQVRAEGLGRSIIDSNATESSKPIQFEGAVFLVTARHLERSLDSLKGSRKNWCNLLKTDSEMIQSIETLRDIQTRIQQVTTILNSDSRSVLRCKRERESLISSAQHLVNYFERLPPHTYLSPKIISEMNEEFEELARCINHCCCWLDELAKSTIETDF